MISGETISLVDRLTIYRLKLFEIVPLALRQIVADLSMMASAKTVIRIT